MNNAYEAVKELPILNKMAISLWGAQYYFGSKWKSKYTGQGRFEVRASEYPVSRLEKAEIMYAAPARYRIRGAMVNVILKSNIGQKPSWSGEVAAMYENSPAGKTLQAVEICSTLPGAFRRM